MILYVLVVPSFLIYQGSKPGILHRLSCYQDNLVNLGVVIGKSNRNRGQSAKQAAILMYNAIKIF